MGNIILHLCISMQLFVNLCILVLKKILSGGGGGIRTLGNLTVTHLLQRCALDHYATPPCTANYTIEAYWLFPKLLFPV